MTRRTTTRIAATLAAVSTAAIVVGVAPAALAARPQTCIASASSGTADASTIAAAKRCIADLTSRANAAARDAQKADERYLQAKLTAKRAADQAESAADSASSAALKAQASRNRAAAITAYLAQTGTGDQATTVMLDQHDAAKALYGISRVSQLTVDGVQASQQASDDSAAAAAAGRAASDAAAAALRDSDDAAAQFAAARKTAEDAAALVAQQTADEQALEVRAGTAPSSVVEHAIVTHLPSNASVGAKVLAFAEAQIGDPYVFAAAGPDAWDCSGLTMAAYASAGIAIGGHSATAQYALAASKGQLVAYSAAQPGDLLFYTDGGGDMYHVAIYAGNGTMVEAPQEGEDVRLTTVRPTDLMSVVARPGA